MTTYTTPGFSTEFDVNDNATSFTDATFTIVAPDGVSGFTYTYDTPGDPSGLGVVTLSSSDYSATVNTGGAEIPLSSAFETEILFIDWGVGNTTFIMSFIIDIGGVDTDFIMVLGGDPLPTLNTLADFIAFEATITAEGQITSGAFAPGMTIPYNSTSAGTTISENDQITGTASDETFDGGAGNDTIDGSGGDDSLLGGIGNDTLLGGAGFDRLSGGAGDDVLNPGDNVNSTSLIFDTILGSLGTDTIIYSDNIVGFQELNYHGLNQGITVSLNGSTNTATVQKESTTDTIVDVINPLNAGWTTGGLGIYGSAENDVFNITLAAEQWMQVRGFEGDNTFNLTLNAGVVRVDYVLNPTFGIMVDLTMGVGNVSDNGLGGVDTINVTGTGGQLELRATSFADTIVGSSGDERFILMGGSDSLDGGGGNDLLRYDRGGVVDGVTVDLAAGTATGTWSGVGFSHSITGIENVRGSNTGGDSLTGDGFVNVLDGRGGNDTLFGGGSADTLLGAAGLDTLYGGVGNDVMNGGDNADNLFGGANNDLGHGDAGNDRLFGDAGNDTLYGDAGNDVIFAGTAEDTAYGGLGDDRLYGNAGFDTVYGEDGADTLFGGAQADNLFGGIGNDTLNGDQGNDRLFGEDGDDTMDGGNNNDALFGGLGADSMTGGTGADSVSGGDGNDTINGGDGADNLFGGIGDDIMTGGQGLDRFFMGAGNDTAFGGTETDAFFGHGGNDVIHGEAGDDRLFGGGGFDTLTGGIGNDTLEGNFNADVFIFADGFGNDIITDYNAFNNFEKIDLSGVTGITDFVDLQTQMAQVVSDVVITDGADTITLLGVNLGDLDAIDFLF